MKIERERRAPGDHRRRVLVERLEGAAQACHAAMILSCEETCREAAARILALEEALSKVLTLAGAHIAPELTERARLLLWEQR